MFRSLLCGCCLLLLGCTARTPILTTPPNIVIILADDMGYSDIGCYGGEIATPHLDRLAANGLKFRHFYNAARCCPTRAALLTGQYPHTAGMGGMVSPVGSNPPAGPYQGYLRPDVPTLAERLRDLGYRTYMSGKWHVGEEPAHWPTRRGFDRYFGLISGASSYYTLRTDQDRLRQMALDSLSWTPPDSGFYATDAYTDFAVERVREHDPSDPFFLYLAFTAPHWPLHVPEESVEPYYDRYAAGWDSLRQERYGQMQSLGVIDTTYTLPPMDEDTPAWQAVRDSHDWQRRMEVYAGMVSRMDAGIGRLVEALEASGQLNNTLLFFLSDNGGSPEVIDGRGLHRAGTPIGQPGSYLAYDRPWSQLSNVPYRKYKAWVDEGGIATPLIVHWPAGLDGQTGWRDTYGHVIDLLPTCLAAAGEGGGVAGATLPGQDLFRLLDAAASADSRPLFWEHQGQQAVRRGRWKLSRTAPELPWRLFDLAADPTEVRDVAELHPVTVRELAAVYESWGKEVGI
ncbi:arylsulfatase [Neolewinella sp.]|uniref:arylsulfatase n=1 Tax=Neolewinella sp. TaxID=2993543 RepID=UPI003B519EDF